MKKVSLILLVCLIVANHSHAQAEIIAVIKAGIVKVIKAVDLKIQRLQNETIWLQNAQKTIENELSKLKLQEIGDWVEKQRTLYADYFDELQQVKNIIVYYHRVKDITATQLKIAKEYRRAFDLFKQDDHFTAGEIKYMEEVYAGILRKSIDNLDQIQIVVNAFNVSMTDAERLHIINTSADAIAENYGDLKLFNHQNQVLSLQRAKDAQEINVVKKMYGL
jgi:hypothetical protein